jgi:predicted enzyme related to lactoylglutathione lyase
VFGWTARESPMMGPPYQVWELNGQTVAGMLPMEGPGWPDDLSPHWMIYFAVDDCDETAALARDLGGRVVGTPESMAMGRYAVLQDPQGGTFSILAG